MNEDIKKAIEVLKEGGIILYPTDTIWGIGCDATNEEAVEKLYAIKQRDKSKSMLILLDNPVKLQTYIQEVPDIAWDLIDLTDKPLTIILDGAKNLATNLISNDGSIGIRITAEDFSRELCMRFRKPIVSTSANITGQPTPQSFNQIDPQILELVDYVVEYRQNEMSKQTPSSIIKLEANGNINIIRK
ncbi:MAG: threonylcarbamoyl-AMP synthase [Bacteroidales bacterium]|jgi:L-threonylcarbamoyladenylate synthase|nr:threonylcarbamoyl-AMP synthase [Bacteroidales bacterium]